MRSAREALASQIRNVLATMAMACATSSGADEQTPSEPPFAGQASGTADEGGQSDQPREDVLPARRPVTARFELKRSLIDRGSTEENTRTTLRAELLIDSPVWLVRLDVPFIDKNNSFTSDALNAGLGDMKVRVAFGPLRVQASTISPLADVVFPTGGSRGSGKYQVAPGVTASIRLPSTWSKPALFWLPLIEHFLSVAGDPSRSDINYTRLELKVEARWPHWIVSLDPRPVIDWTQGVRTAADIELQGTWVPSGHWRLWLKAGRRLWGDTLPTTYDDKLEIGVRGTL